MSMAAPGGGQHLSLLDHVVRIRPGEARALKKVHHLRLPVIPNQGGREALPALSEPWHAPPRPGVCAMTGGRAHYVMCFLSRKYSSFFMPMVRRRRTSSRSTCQRGTGAALRIDTTAGGTATLLHRQGRTPLQGDLPGSDCQCCRTPPRRTRTGRGCPHPPACHGTLRCEADSGIAH